MLKIVINGVQADLEGIKFTLQLRSPIPFSPDDTGISGSFAFGAFFPGSNTNKEIFEFPHRLEKYPETEKDFPAYMEFEGRRLFDVIVSLTEASDRGFNTNIKIDIGYYSTEIGEKSLRDLEYDGVISLGTTTTDVRSHAMLKVNQTWPQAKYNFPVIYNEKFYGEANIGNPSWQKLVNYYSHGVGFLPNSLDGNTVNNYYNLCPLPYLFYVLSRCFSEFGYQVTGQVLQDTELASLLIYNNYALDEIVDRYKVKVALTEDMIIRDDYLVLFDDIIIDTDDCWDLATHSYLVKVGGDIHIEANLTMAIEVSNFPTQYFVWIYLDDVEIGYFGGDLNSLQEDLIINFDHSLYDYDIGKRITMRAQFKYGGVVCDGYILADSWFSIQNIPWSLLNTYAKTIEIRNHVPDIKISAFLVSLFKAFGIIYSFSQKTKTAELLFLSDILGSVDEDVYTDLTVKSSKLARFRETRSYKLNFAWSSQDEYTKENFKTYDAGKLLGLYNTYAHLPSLAIEGQFAIVRNLNAVYQWVTDAWVWFTDRYQPYLVGEGKTAISIELSPLMMYADYSGATKKVYPKILQEGSSPQLGMKDFGFHLLFYRGKLEDNEEHTYPFASPTRYGPMGEIVGNYELVLDGDNGLFKTFLEDYYNFVINRGRPVEYDRHFSAAEIQALNFLRKKRIFQNVFFMDEISIPLSNTSIDKATMKLLKA
jgi:hypothetical protein